MQAIQTTFVGQGAKQAAKIVARSGISKTSVPYNPEMDMHANHAAAVIKLCKELGLPINHKAGIFGDSTYWVPLDYGFAAFVAPTAQEPVEAPSVVQAMPHAADPQTAPTEASTALAEPIAEPAKPARVRRAA